MKPNIYLFDNTNQLQPKGYGPIITLSPTNNHQNPPNHPYIFITPKPILWNQFTNLLDALQYISNHLQSKHIYVHTNVPHDSLFVTPLNQNYTIHQIC